MKARVPDDDGGAKLHTRGTGVMAGRPGAWTVAQHEQAHPLALLWVCRDLAALQHEEADVPVPVPVAEPAGGQLVAEPVRRPVERGGQELGGDSDQP